MQSPLREVKGPMCRSMLLMAALMAMLSLPAQLFAAKQVAMTVEVPAGQHRSLRLRNMVKDVVLGVVVQVPDKVGVSLLSELDYRRYPKAEEPVFASIVEKQLSFTVTIPQNGDYFLVFDNRQGIAAQKAKFVVRAEQKSQQQPTPATPAPPNTKRDQF